MKPPAVDIFDFWHDVPTTAFCHPLDKKVLDRVEHHFELDCLLGPYMGRLRTAPVVLLFLSPGFEEEDRAHARSATGQDYYARQRSGRADLPSNEEHPGAHRWVQRILKQFGVSWDEARETVAFLNISPYKSKSFLDGPMLAALPSCRATLDWAQCVLFPQAEAGERLVICLRSASYWGLGRRLQIPGSLLVPKFTRNDSIFRTERDEVVDEFHLRLHAAQSIK